MFQLPENFKTEVIYIQVNSQNIENFIADLQELNIPYYNDAINFVNHWDQDDNIVGCFWDNWDKCVHINGHCNGADKIISYESLLIDKQSYEELLNMI